MKLYRIEHIEEILKQGRECGNRYVGFDLTQEGNLLITYKKHEPGRSGADGCEEDVEEIELSESAGEY